MKNLLLFLISILCAIASFGQVQFGGQINARNNSGVNGPIRRTVNGLQVSDSVTQRLLSNPLLITGNVGITGTVALDSSKTRLNQQVNVLNFPTTQPISASALPLPTNAATETGHLASIDTKTPALGQAVSGSSVPVVLPAAQITTLTPPAAITNYANETGGNLAAIKTDVDKIPSQGQAVAGSSMPVVLPAAQITTLTPPAAIINYANESGGNLAAINTNTAKIPAKGSALTANSTPVNIASDQTVPISAASIPLPSLASTSTKQSDGSQKTQIVDGSGNVVGSTSNALDVNIKSGASAGTQYAEGATAATATGTVAMVKNGTTVKAAQGDASGNLRVDLSQTSANSTAIKVDGSAVTQPVSGTVNVQGGNSTAVKVDGSTVTQPVSASSLPLPTSAATSTKQSDGTQKTQVVDGIGNVVGSTGNALDVNIKSGSGGNGAASNTGSAVPAQADYVGYSNAGNLQGVSSSNPLPVVQTGTPVLATNAAQETGNLAAIAANTSKIPSVGQATAANSQPVTTATDEIGLQITGQATQTATVNNIIPASSGASATDCSLYRSFAIQINSTGTAGTFIFEGSNDNSNFLPIPVFNGSLLQPVTIVSAITATSSKIIYVGACSFPFIRVRIATTITGGSIQAFTYLSRAPFAPSSTLTVQQQTAGNLNALIGNIPTAATSTDAVANPFTSLINMLNHSFNGTTWDRTHGNWNTTTGDAGAKTTSFNGATQTNFDSRGAMITVLCGTVSGTTPTLVAQLQWSPDAGTTWINFGAASSTVTTTGNTITFQVYPTNSSTAGATPAALTLGSTQSVQINAALPRSWRLAYTITGTTPSFAITAVYVNYQL